MRPEGHTGRRHAGSTEEGFVYAVGGESNLRIDGYPYRPYRLRPEAGVGAGAGPSSRTSPSRTTERDLCLLAVAKHGRTGHPFTCPLRPRRGPPRSAGGSGQMRESARRARTRCRRTASGGAESSGCREERM